MIRIFSINENYGHFHFADDKLLNSIRFGVVFFILVKRVCFAVSTEASLSIENMRRSSKWTVGFTHGLLFNVDAWTLDTVAKSSLKHMSCKVFQINSTHA